MDEHAPLKQSPGVRKTINNAPCREGATNNDLNTDDGELDQLGDRWNPPELIRGSERDHDS